ncbi:hypothetical protein FRACA_2900002 [Frankia canadensis]|uniref:Uncharacterized protein n=1 Tax=Frankia canadensis TaxID=1836972 RepID=A0A2I2KTF2_9ACTN|nr:hypothetical protein FRACA_2900002 [Frankia canadensis]SOU56216.1 hypothetical protein FRACA_2900002 [Frankia canadensis]
MRPSLRCVQRGYGPGVSLTHEKTLVRSLILREHDGYHPWLAHTSPVFPTCVRWACRVMFWLFRVGPAGSWSGGPGTVRGCDGRGGLRAAERREDARRAAGRP